jgi:hypothetical protein
VELLVALALSSLLLALVFSLHLFTNKLVFNWQKKASLEDTASLYMETLTRDLKMIDRILEAGEKEISFKTLADKEFQYVWDGIELTRNENPLTKAAATVEEFELTYFGSVSDSDTVGKRTEQIEFDTDFRYLQQQDKLDRVSGIQMKLVLKGQDKSVTLSNFVRLNKAISVY